MEGQSFVLGAGLISMFALVVVLRFKPTLLAAGDDIYRHLSSGLVIMALVATARLINSAGVLSAIPFFSEPLFFKLTIWIATITGVVLLAGGISGWVESRRSERTNKGEQDIRFDLVKRVEEAASDQNRPDTLLREGLDCLACLLGARTGAVLVHSRRTGQLRVLGATDESAQNLASLKAISMTVSSGHERGELDPGGRESVSVAVPDGLEEPRTVMPVHVEGKVAALFLFWSRPTTMSSGDKMAAKLLTDIMGRGLEDRKRRAEIDFMRLQNDHRERMREIVDSGGTFDDRVVRLARLLREKIGTEYLSLTVGHVGRDSQRYTVGKSGTLLSEKGLDPLWLEDLSPAPESGAGPTLINDESDQVPAFVRDIMSATGMTELFVIPIQIDHQIAAIMVLGPVVSSATSGQRLHTLRNMVPGLSRMVAAEIARHNEEQSRRRQTLVNRILVGDGSHSDSQKVCRTASNILLRELRTSFVRISTFEENGAFLRSRALGLTHTPENMVPEDGYMIMSLMPYHRLVRDSGRLMVINQSNGEGRMTLAETRQMYRPDLNSALLVPLLVGQQVVGIVSLADRRRRGRYEYTPSDVLFVSSVAAALARVLGDHSETARTSRAKSESMTAARPTESSLRTGLGQAIKGESGSKAVTEPVLVGPRNELAELEVESVVERTDRD